MVLSHTGSVCPTAALSGSNPAGAKLAPQSHAANGKPETTPPRRRGACSRPDQPGCPGWKPLSHPKGTDCLAGTTGGLQIPLPLTSIRDCLRDDAESTSQTAETDGISRSILRTGTTLLSPATRTDPTTMWIYPRTTSHLRSAGRGGFIAPRKPLDRDLTGETPQR